LPGNEKAFFENLDSLPSTEAEFFFNNLSVSTLPKHFRNRSVTVPARGFTLFRALLVWPGGLVIVSSSDFEAFREYKIPPPLFTIPVFCMLDPRGR